jgi:hypothetical protein
MIGVGISAGLTGAKRARSIQDPLPALDLDWATDRSLPAAYGPTPSFSRASTGTYFTSSGVLTTAAINAPRFNHVYNGSSWVSKGLLIEEQRTNSCRSSGDLANVTYWQRNTSGSGQSVTANSAAAPDGTNTAALMVNGTGPYWVANLASITYANGTAYTFSVWLKRKSGTGNVWINTNPYGSGGTWLVLTITSEWVRYSVTQTATATTTPVQAPGVYVDQAGQEVYVWGAQLEAGAFPTSYIPTTTAAVTRSADVCQITGTDFSGFWNASEGSLVYEADSSSNVIGNHFVFLVSDGTFNNQYQSSRSQNNAYTDVGFWVKNGNVWQALIYTSAGAWLQGATSKDAMAYKVDDFAFSDDGSAVLTDASGTLPTVNRMEIGGSSLISAALNGHIARLRYFNTRLTNSKLQELST